MTHHSDECVVVGGTDSSPFPMSVSISNTTSGLSWSEEQEHEEEHEEEQEEEDQEAEELDMKMLLWMVMGDVPLSVAESFRDVVQMMRPGYTPAGRWSLHSLGSRPPPRDRGFPARPRLCVLLTARPAAQARRSSAP